MNLSKLTTPQLQSKIDNNKIPEDQVEAARALLTKRLGAVKAEPAAKDVKKKAAPKKKAEPKPTAKKKAEVKKETKEKDEKKSKSFEDYQTGGVSGLVRKMLTPKDGSKVAGCTYSQANQAVQKRFERKLYPSEFDRNFKVLKALGILEERQKPHFVSDSVA